MRLRLCIPFCILSGIECIATMRPDCDPFVVNHMTGTCFDHPFNSIHLHKLHEGESSGTAIRESLDVNIVHLAKFTKMCGHFVFAGALSKTANENRSQLFVFSLLFVSLHRHPMLKTIVTARSRGDVASAGLMPRR
mmetsp:Transcript_10278/g.28725  ORF Transcript_10278/g.28725 Transcript_10278/m.28725 type:complete len:136 (-) Transcript_10278:318-725(-)